MSNSPQVKSPTSSVTYQLNSNEADMQELPNEILSDELDLSGKRLVLGLTGGIACYKSAELCRLFIKAGAQVQVVMTEAACQFITPTTMQALSGQAVHISQWDLQSANAMPHINLSRSADAIVLAPCSADFLARLAQGRSDELLSLLCLARPHAHTALLIAPAMNQQMWLHPATQRNLQQVQSDGASILGVASGLQACGEYGDGRMLEPEQILHDVIAFFKPKLLQNLRVLITAGPTYEAIDPVRGLTNRSSGKMGYSIARAAQEAGAHVTLVSGPTALVAPRNVLRINVQSGQEMLIAVEQNAQNADIFIATAAVADWRPTHTKNNKIKKKPGQPLPALNFTENPDILATVANSPRAQNGALYCVGFAAESENLIGYASAKRLRKNIPLLVGNIGPKTFGRDNNVLTLFDEHGHKQLPQASKRTLARQLLIEIATRMNQANDKSS